MSEKPKPPLISLPSAARKVSQGLGTPPLTPLIVALQELGYVYEEQFVIEPRGSEGKAARFPALAGELVALHPDVIVSAGALQQAEPVKMKPRVAVRSTGNSRRVRDARLKARLRIEILSLLLRVVLAPEQMSLQFLRHHRV